MELANGCMSLYLGLYVSLISTEVIVASFVTTIYTGYAAILQTLARNQSIMQLLGSTELGGYG